MSWQKLLTSLVVDAPRDLLMMSKMDCHAKKVSSIVFGRNSKGGLNRFFMAWPGHELSQNHAGGSFPVGIHNHRYDILIRPVFGKVTHYFYGEGKGKEFNKFKFTTGGTDRPPSFEFLGKFKIFVQSSDFLSEIYLPFSQLHNIACDGPAVWIVKEGRVHQDSTLLFTPRLDVETGGLYKPFTSDKEILNHIKIFTNLTN